MMAKWLDWVDSDEAGPVHENESDRECPDLLSLYTELSAMRQTMSRGLRRTHEEVVGLSRQIAAPAEESAEEESGKKFALGLAEMFTRMNRISDRMQTQPEGGVFVGNWRQEWSAVRDALDIIRSHFESILSALSIEEIETDDRLFDPSSMMAVSGVDTDDKPDGMVVEVVSPGYRRGDTVLKYAEVTVARNERKPQ
jgi:molecular chaperone GrpE (heat shock protein)